MNKNTENLVPRKKEESSSLVKVERNPENFMTEAATESVEAFDVPHGAFSGIATYRENGEDYRISKTLDRLMAENYTNHRYIVKELNSIGPISTKDPRERYEGDIDDAIEQTKQDLASYNTQVEEEIQNLKQKQGQREISEKGYERALQILEDAREIYNTLIKELELKKRGLEFIGSDEITGDDAYRYNNFANKALEIKYLPGGNIAVLRGYSHNPIWQKNFGDNRFQDLGLAQIYNKAQYIAIEGFIEFKLGESLKCGWNSSRGQYDRLMKEFIKEGFTGKFLELDSRFEGRQIQSTFESELSLSGTITRKLSLKEAKILFSYIQKYNPELAEKIGDIDRFIEFFHKQRTQGAEKSSDRIEKRFGLLSIHKGTYYQNRASVTSNLKTSSTFTGFELGAVAFTDALAVIKILLMNNAMYKGEIKSGLLVDFEGINHLSSKSYFFDNPQYAMEVVLTNLHEILASHPEIKDREDILDRLQNLDKDTWQWVFEFIGTLPFSKVAEPTKEYDSVEEGWRQRPMTNDTPYSAVDNLDDVGKQKLDGVINKLVNI